MQVLQTDRNKVTLSLTVEDVYTLLQCVAEIRDTRSEGDIEAIIGVKREQLAAFAGELNKIKQAMLGSEKQA
jgi:hypothetical protein